MLEEIRRDEGTPPTVQTNQAKKTLSQEQIRALALARRAAGSAKKPPAQ